MADLYLVRHGQTELNVQSILQGWHDSPLTARGREQALAARTAFAARGVAFDHVYSSPLGRARHTAELIVGEGRSIELVDDLREWHFGSLEGTSNREMPPQPWGDYPVAFGGESEVQLQSRMVAALSRIMARPQHDCVLAVSHGSACQEFLEYVTGGGGATRQRCRASFWLLRWGVFALGLVTNERTPMNKDLYLVRHGQTIFNLKRIIQGWSDSPLTQLGCDQAARAGMFLRARGIEPDHAYTSTLHRTEQTIANLWPGLAYERLDGLREWFFGDFEAERVMLMPERPWRDFYRQFGGEGQVQVRERMVTTLTELMRRPDHECVLAVSHGSAIKEFLDHVRGAAADERERVPGNCSVLHFVFDDEAGTFELIEIFTQEDYARELGLEPLVVTAGPQRG